MISSLQYSIGIKRYKRASPKSCFVQVLHGVAWPINGRVKAKLVNGVAKYSRKYFDKVVTVSYLSYALNMQINNIKCDAIIHNGCHMKPIFDLPSKERIYDVIYIGRLYRDKNVELICDAFTTLLKNNKTYKFAVGGYGELEHLFTEGKYKNSGITFLGRLNSNDVRRYMSQSKFFISMHPTETFGTVFNEAILCGCNIITQSTGGISSLLIKKPYFHIADSLDSEDLAKKIQLAEKNHIFVTNEERENLSSTLNYREIAKEYKNLTSR